MGGQIFLSKDGKKFGPYSTAQIEAMRASGEIFAYSWLWDQTEPRWQAIEPPPPPPGAPDTMDSIPEPPRTQARSVRGAERVANASVAGMIEALCHDNCNIVSGKLQEISSHGAKLVAIGQQTPSFADRSAVTLNLLDPRTGRSINVRGKISGISRSGRQWIYLIQWNTDSAALSQLAS